MAEDTYEREDNRSYCQVNGHNYREVSSTTRRWTEKDSVYDGEEAVYSTYAGCYTGETRSKYRTIKVNHAIDTVVYECSRCGHKVTREENKR